VSADAAIARAATEAAKMPRFFTDMWVPFLVGECRPAACDAPISGCARAVPLKSRVHHHETANPRVILRHGRGILGASIRVRQWGHQQEHPDCRHTPEGTLRSDEPTRCRPP